MRVRLPRRASRILGTRRICANARIGVLSFELSGNDEGDAVQIHFNGDRFSMNIIATETFAAKDYASCTRSRGFTQRSTAENLDVEAVTSNPLLPIDRKWAIRFTAGGTATIILGMKDYGRGWFSAYFAGLAAVRLGIPLRQIRLYYSATLPAVPQTSRRDLVMSRRSQIGPIASAVADIIEELCDRVIAKGRSALAATAGVDDVDVGFDQTMGRFFVMDRDRSRTVLEIAEASRITADDPQLTVRGRPSRS